MKRFFLFFLCAVLLCGCSRPGAASKTYTETFLSLFDTVTTVTGTADSEEAFQAMVQPIRQELERYHRLFDIYNEYEGLNNLKTLNDRAGLSPVTVDPEILALLEDCKAYSAATGGCFNPAMGSVLRLWHDARQAGLEDPEHARLPDPAQLQEAACHIDPNDIVLDWENSTVFFQDPALQLDVGAIAKGWAVQQVCEHAPEGLLINVGGNVCATGPKRTDGTPWTIGIQDPDGSGQYLQLLAITGGSVVTSGSYQRTYSVDGQSYHHIIDPVTLYPGERWCSVTVVAEDSGLADALSTALFLLEPEQGQELLDQFGACAMWVDPSGQQVFSTGFEALLVS